MWCLYKNLSAIYLKLKLHLHNTQYEDIPSKMYVIKLIFTIYFIAYILFVVYRVTARDQDRA